MSVIRRIANVAWYRLRQVVEPEGAIPGERALDAELATPATERATSTDRASTERAGPARDVVAEQPAAPVTPRQRRL